ncbi:MAG TPA: hypothetical protein DGD08_08490 [Gemmatimonas aurantiaca]|uniref:Uncharacterized protein n=2 Tax=Gemmatimonas aurantiaca TaxID=173480 RepID=C1A454_GEMAT|nr:hypothetical protein [Gemmatimonas aurantiaca]BAH38879.1 hypothetical protein GAU_1837 [Gemmatimonas aurantiaca T-27]HCT57236.1 hypothetical protein [Gemmatimonas aurantiaca]
MAKIGSLYLPFGGSALDPALQATSTAPTSATEDAGNLVIESLAGNVKAGVESVATFDWTESSITVHVPVASGTSPSAMYIFAATSTLLGPCINYQGSRPSAGAINASTGSYGNSALGTAGRPWARIAHAAGTLTWSQSADGVTWSVFHSVAASGFGSLAAVKLRIMTENASVLTFRIAQIGLPPAGPSTASTDYYRRQLGGLTE